MAYNFIPDSVAVAGTGSSANLIASSAGQSITVWQLLIAGTANDTVSITWTAGGTSTTAKVILLANTTIQRTFSRTVAQPGPRQTPALR